MAKKKRLKPPSEKEIKRLPRWAQVAFAARCARRVQPLFQAGWPDAPAQHLKAVERAIRVAEKSAANASSAAGYATSVAASSAAGYATSVAASSSASAASSASCAAEAAGYAVSEAAYAAATGVVSVAAIRAAYAAVGAVGGTVAEGPVLRAMRADFEKLKAAQREGWTDETPAPPEFFGPLWPEGEPPGWPAIHATAEDGVTVEDRAIAEVKEKMELPSKEEIGRLPRWARVAFAARCARRVQPLFQAGWPDVPTEHVKAIEGAIRLAEELSAHAATRVADGKAAEQAAKTAGERAGADGAYAAAYTAGAAAAAVAGKATIAAAHCESAASAAVETIDALAPRSHLAVVRAMRMDFERLRAVAQKDGWTRKTRVPPEFFGPLWPEGVPEGWPAIQTKERVFERGPMSLYFDRSEFNNEQIAEAIALLSELYGTVGGDRLVIKGTTLFVPERQPVPEGV